MNRGKYIIVTNNPLVNEKYGNTHNVIYEDVSYEDILKTVRDRIHGGHQMLTHPLSGSVKPNETPYKSVMISEERGTIDERAVMLIENAIDACRKFELKSDRYKPEVYKDFQLIDCTLIESGMASADAAH